MSRSALTAALFALSGTALVVPTAAAAPPLDPPTVTIEGGDLTVSELQGFTVSDIHPSAADGRVTVTYGGRALTPLVVVEGPVGVFTATGELETWGLAGQQDLVVAQCSDAAATLCGDPTTLTTTVENAAPTHDLSRPGSEFSTPFTVTPHLQVATGSPRIRVTVDTGTPSFGDPEAAQTIDTDALSAGVHQAFIAVCSADEQRCAPGQTFGFTVTRTVPGTFAVSAPAFSPNGDGQFDSVSFNYTQGVVWTSAAVVVRNAANEQVFDSAVPLPQLPSNDGTLLFDGKDNDGVVLPDGTYTATLTVSRSLDSGDVASSAFTQPFTVDNTAQAPAALTPTFSTIYPHVDGYRDKTSFTFTAAEPYSQRYLQVFTPAPGFQLVFAKQVNSPSDAIWSGQDQGGARVPAGPYKVRLRVVDVLGNEGFTPLATVTVSDKKVVTVTKSVTVTPKASRIDGQTGACSTRRTPSAHGWVGSTGYLSNTRCRNGFNASIVWTHNRVKLASAVKYYWVRLGWFGGPTRAATHDRAIATLYGTDSSAQGWFSSLDYLAGQYIPQVAGSKVVKAGYVSWGFQADRGNRYDVKSFTITYKADVLR